MAHRVLDIDKWNDMVSIFVLGLPEEVFDSTEDVGLGEALEFGSDGTFICYQGYLFSEDYPSLVKIFRAKSSQERYDAPTLGLEDVDILTVLDELRKRDRVEGLLLDFKDFMEKNPEAAMEILGNPEIVRVMRRYGVKNIPEFPLVEKYRLEKRMKASEAKWVK